jgi:hypothetical protein
MSHFAKVIDGVVTDMLVATQAEINSEKYGDAFLWVQTSYNGNFRGKYASIGDTWDKVNERFIQSQLFPSWTLDTNFNWQAPIAYPTDGLIYSWDEETLAWVEVTDVT